MQLITDIQARLTKHQILSVGYFLRKTHFCNCDNKTLLTHAARLQLQIPDECFAVVCNQYRIPDRVMQMTIAEIKA